MGNVSITTKVKDGEYSHYPDVSDKTCEKIKALITADKPKPKFEPIRVCCFTINVENGLVRVKAKIQATQNSGCVLSQSNLADFTLALQKAKADVEANE